MIKKLGEKILILGGANSGKSIWAEKQLKDKKNVMYIATSMNDETDILWTNKIQKHKDRRPSTWHTIEGSEYIWDKISKANESASILVESIGGLITWYLDYDDYEWDLVGDLFIKSIKESKNKIILVSEEVGLGVIPMTSQGNLFLSRIGKINQALNTIVNQKWFVINGIAIDYGKIGVNVFN